MSLGGPYFYATELCPGEWPTGHRVFAALGLRGLWINRFDAGVDGRTLCSTSGPGRSPSWMVALVVASVVHPEPPEELLAAATAILGDGAIVLTG